MNIRTVANWIIAAMTAITVLTLLAILQIWLTPAARAQQWTRSCEMWEPCYYREMRREERRRAYKARGHYHRPQVHYYAPPQTPPQIGPQCHTLVAAVGEEKYGPERAKEAAETAWMERSRFLFGTRYMDIKNARRLTYECSRSSTGNRASEKAAERLAGSYLEQCEVRAEPCKAERERDR